MIHEIPLVLGGVAEVCDVCGNGDPVTIGKCKASPDVELPFLRVGQTVRLVRCRKNEIDPVTFEGCVQLDEFKSYTVTDVHYSKPGPWAMQIAMAALGSVREDQLEQEPVHRIRFFVKDSRGIVTSYWDDELMLWEDGEDDKLETVGVIRLPPVFVRSRPSLWGRLKSFIGR